jgi:hypothetical protein
LLLLLLLCLYLLLRHACFRSRRCLCFLPISRC